MADFTVRDNRGFTRHADPETSIIVARGSADVQRALALGQQGSIPADPQDLQHAGMVRRSNHQKLAASFGGGSGSSYSFATQRPLDPMFYWRESGMPYELDDEEVLKELRKWCRFVYRSDPTLASAIDVFSKYPVLGMEFQCKSDQLVDFYTDLMLDEDSDLNYPDYLIDIGREYWTVGEAWPMGYFDETLGIWESDELLQPDDITVEKSPFLKDPRFTMKLPEHIRRLLQTKDPKWEYEALIQSYPELKDFALGVDKQMPVSNVLLKQLKFTGDTFNPRGLPILLRCLRACISEELLHAAQDAIASRFYTPLIHAQIGASAQDLGTERPWVPTRTDLENFLADVDAALAADFRVLATHFAVQMTSVFGRENMPNLDMDFERLKGNKLQAFGLSETMLSGADQGETYAADALNRDLVSQLLVTYQRKLKRFVKSRMKVVAEAQEHYDYDERNGKRYVINEEVLVITEDGQRVIEEQPKLLIPDVQMASMSMKSEQERIQFIEALRASGMPISMQTRMRAMNQSGLNLNDEIDISHAEQVDLAVAEQEVRRDRYLALKAKGLPIDPDLAADFDPKPVNAAEIQQQQALQQQVALPDAQMGANPVDPSMAEAPTRSPQLGVDDPTTPNLAPNPNELAVPPGAPLTMPPNGPGGTEVMPPPGAPPPGLDDGSGGQLIPLPRNKARPDESDEMRAGMPTAGLRFLNDPRHLGSRRRRRDPDDLLETADG